MMIKDKAPKVEEQENVALVGKGQENGSITRPCSKGEQKKKDLSKVKCFGSDQHGHSVSQFPDLKKGYKKG